jgi:hypothetical protein
MRYQPTLIQLNRAEGVGYEGRATIKLQPGITYSTIELETNLAKRETIKRIAIDVNGNEIVYASGVELDLIDQVLGKHRASGRFILDLARFEYRSIAGIRQKELVTLPTDDVTLIVEFGAKDAADPTTPTMKGKAWALNNQTGQYFMPSMYRVTQNIAAAGEHEFVFPNAAPNRWIQRLMFNETNATISKIEIFRGALRIFEGSRQDVEFAMQRLAGYSPIGGRFVFDPTITGFGTHGAMNTGQRDSLKFKLTVDSPGAMEVLVEGYDQVASIPQPQ